MDKIKIGEKEYHIKFSQYVLMKFLRKNKIKASEMQTAINNDLVLMYELAYEAVKMGEKKAGNEFEMDLDVFSMDIDAGTGIADVMNLFAKSQGLDPDDIEESEETEKK